MTPPCKKVKNLLCYLNFDFSDDEVERGGHSWIGSEVGPESLASKPTCFPSQHLLTLQHLEEQCPGSPFPKQVPRGPSPVGM